ncbi:hypothetical protein HYV11_01330 [Candidatus Dependentiae bacterium]|nr:hypothetical protein [Candidatus Dependentiae bacterium]
MKLLKKIFIAVLIGIIVLYGCKKYLFSIQTAFPKQCSFFIDKQLSSSYQSKLKDFVNHEYLAGKDAKQILDGVNDRFLEIEAMNAYICKTDRLCFSFDASHPLFLLNDYLVCHNGKMIPKMNYQDKLIDDLVKITLQNDQSVDVLINFFSAVCPAIFKEFDVAWNGENEIVLSLKNNKKDCLLFSSKNIPTLELVTLFKQNQQQRKGNKGLVYDFRFSNQMIIK